MKSLWATVIFLALAVPAQAEAIHVENCEGRNYELPAGFTVICSASWSLDGFCIGEDLWDKWKVNGRTQPGDAFIRPWLPARILVRGYELIRTNGNKAGWYGIGSGIVADMALWLGEGEMRNARIFPAGIVQPWPSKEESEAQRAAVNDLIDVHGSCLTAPDKKTPDAINLMLTVYYTPWPAH